jgi:predicted transcriptional regulator
MKPMTITIDEETIRKLDEVAAALPGVRSRSALVRTAIRDFIDRERQRQLEAHERDILRRHRQKLKRQAVALIQEQAQP